MWLSSVYECKFNEQIGVGITHGICDCKTRPHGAANQRVNGTVKVKLYKGKADVVAMESPYSLFDANLATFNKDASFNQNASAGFIEIYNLAQKTYHRLS